MIDLAFAIGSIQAQLQSLYQVCF